MIFNPRYCLSCMALIGMICLSGCEKKSEEEQELAEFSAFMADFTAYIQDTNEKINGLDTSDRGSADELLAILDGMDAEFARFAELEVPAQYKSIEKLADEASESMSVAVSYYHTAYETEGFSKNDADIAYQHYERVMERIKYIGYVLAGGEIPENDHVTVYEESNDGNLLDKWLSDDDEPGTEGTQDSTDGG